MAAAFFRNYQKEVLDKINALLPTAHKKNMYIVLPTGTGKTRIFTNIKTAENILVLVHRELLRKQIIKEFAKQALPALEIGSGKHLDSATLTHAPHIVVATIQTLSKDMGNFDSSWFDLIVIDECHHTEKDARYAQVLASLDYNLCLGFTATPPKHSTVFTSADLLYEMTIFEAWKDGWLLQPKLYHVELHWDKSKFKHQLENFVTDYTEEELEKSLLTYAESNFEIILEALHKVNNAERSIVFFPTVQLSKEFQKFCTSKNQVCYSITAETKLDDRERYINEFKNNRKIILCNVYVLTEGIDIPEIETIFVARPTTNQITAKQIYGRAMRLCDNKTSCTIIEGMLPDKNWLCQQTFETAYMEIPFDIHKRVVPRSLLQYIEKEINNSNTPIEKLYEQLQRYINWFTWLCEDRYLNVDTHNIDSYFFLSDTSVAGSGRVVFKDAKTNLFKTVYNIYYKIDLKTYELKLQAGLRFSIHSFNSVSECFAYLHNAFGHKGDVYPFSRIKKGRKELITDKQKNLLNSKLTDVMPSELAACLLQTVNKRKASEVIAKIFILEKLEKWSENLFIKEEQETEEDTE